MILQHDEPHDKSYGELHDNSLHLLICFQVSPEILKECNPRHTSQFNANITFGNCGTMWKKCCLATSQYRRFKLLQILLRNCGNGIRCYKTCVLHKTRFIYKICW